MTMQSNQQAHCLTFVITDNKSPFAIPHCPNDFDPSVAAFNGENKNGSDANESLEMTTFSSMPRMADAKLDKSERVVDGDSDMASVLEDGG